jgi:hypothetical protein
MGELVVNSINKGLKEAAMNVSKSPMGNGGFN